MTQLAISPTTSPSTLPIVAPQTVRWLEPDDAIGTSRRLAVHQLVENQVARTPGATAIGFGRRKIAYALLNRHANRLARTLRRRGIGPGDIVGICMRRTPDAMAALLAVMKSGAAYLPLDAEQPVERLQQMATDARIAALLFDDADRRWLAPRRCGAIRVEIDWDDDEVRRGDADVRSVNDADDLAYVLYTSGSTGAAKGVAMPHRPLVNLLRWQSRCWRDESGARTLQFASLGFDVSFQEIFSTWITGGTLLPADESVRRDPRELLRMIVDQRIERMFLPVVMLHRLADAAEATHADAGDLREIIVAGERLEITPAVEQMFRHWPDCRLVNHYGPTETHVVTAHEVAAPLDHRNRRFPPIGRPIDGVAIHLLDARGRKVKRGEVGEIFIGGAAVARGYLGRDDLTRQRFLPDPFSRTGRLYRTGDLARRRADGCLVFEGRIDDQVKIRGHRVEPAETAAVIQRHPDVAKAVVLAENDAAGNKQLAAHLVTRTNGQTNLAQLREFAAKLLPEPMVPARFVLHDELPVSPNGKIDRRALAAMQPPAESPAADCLAPRDAWELGVAQVWEQVLGCRQAGLDDDFFACGGNSLLAMELASRIERRFGREISIARLVERPTIAGIAAAVSDASTDAWTPLVPLRATGRKRPFFCVHPAGGNALCYLHLARYLDKDQPFFGLQARGIDGRLEPARSIEEMAIDYVRAIRLVQPRGPYALGGWSFGGTIAYEMARLLQASGETVNRLAMMDTGVMYSVQLMQSLFPSDNGGILGMLLADPSKQLDMFRSIAADTDIIPSGADVRLAGSIRDIFRANAKAMLDYRPDPYRGTLTLFLGQQPAIQARFDPLAEWQELVDHVLYIPTPGCHFTLCREPHVRTLAEKLQAWLG